MTKKIIVITTTELRRYFEEAFEKIQPSYDIEICEYDNFRNLASIYSLLEDKADGFLVSGSVAKKVIEKSHKNHKKPILTVQMDQSNIYKLLLNLKIENKDLDVSRIVFDYLLNDNSKLSVIDIIKDSNLTSDDLGTHFNEWLDNTSLEKLYTLEEEITEKIVTLWYNKKIDLVVNFYSSIISQLRNKGIPCILAYPRIENILNATISIQHHIKINQLSANLPVIISISPQKIEDNEVSEWNMISLHKHLLDFKHNEIADYLIQKEKDGFSIITNVQSSKDIIDFEQYRLENYLRKCLDFRVVVGYGVGNTITQAKNNSMNARKEAITNGNSFLIDENNNLVGPLKSDKLLNVSSEATPDVQQIAKASHLSTLTIQKLISIMNVLDTKEITSRDIASHMGVTIRNANRIISNLEKNNLAISSHERSTSTKGRPIKVYQILF